MDPIAPTHHAINRYFTYINHHFLSFSSSHYSDSGKNFNKSTLGNMFLHILTNPCINCLSNVPHEAPPHYFFIACPTNKNHVVTNTVGQIKKIRIVPFSAVEVLNFPGIIRNKHL